MMVLLLTLLSTTDAVILTGSSEYALPGGVFTLRCEVPEEANTVQLYRRPNGSPVGSIQVSGSHCYNTITTKPAICSPDVCSCTTTSTDYGTVFQWVIQPQTGDHGSVWFCTRTNPTLSTADKTVDSVDYTLKVTEGPRTVTLSPPDTTYTRTEGDTLPDITCAADCIPGCSFVWTKPDNTNFTASAVLSLGQLERSEHGTYRCTARNGIGVLTTTTSVTIQYGPRSVTLSPPDTTYTRFEGDTLPDITCAADCIPGCSFVWTKPDNTNFTASAVLSLGQLERSEHGTYRCTARNGIGVLTTTTSVTIQYGPRSVTLSPPDTTYTRFEGDTLPDITCAADCIPGCSFVWTKPDNTNFTASAVLSLGQLERSEHGTYRCTARNGIGVLTTTTSVTIQYGPGTSIALSPPATTYTRTEGDTLPDITCTADCRPGCTFVWTKPDNTNFTASAVLSLGQLGRSEHGTSRCTARNGVGESTLDIRVNVASPANNSRR